MKRRSPLRQASIAVSLLFYGASSLGEEPAPSTGARERLLAPRVTITYDHFLGTLKTDPDPLPLLQHGQLVEFRVQNVNTFIYTVRVALRAVDEFATVPSAIASLAKGPELSAPPEPAPPPAPAMEAIEVVGRAPSYEDELMATRKALVKAEEAVRLPTAIEQVVFSDETNPREMLRIVDATAHRFLPDSDDATLPFAWEEQKLAAREHLTALERLATTTKQKAEVRELRARQDGLDRDRATVNRLREAEALVAQVREALFKGPTATAQATGDLLVIELESQLLPGRTGTRVFKSTQYLQLETTGGVVVNFSTGLAFSSLQDRQYAVDEEGKIRRRGAEDEFAVIPTALAHVALRSPSSWRWAPISFGIGLGGDRLHYFLGTSVLAGRRRRIVVTAGLTGGQVEVLGGGLEVGDPADSSVGTIPLEPRFNFGGFLGITFNLTPNN